MNSAQNPAEDSPRSWRGRVQLLLILALVIGPMVLASGMYFNGFWVPQGRSYSGEMIAGRIDLDALGVRADQKKTWQLLITAPHECLDECQQLIYLARQIHIGLNRDASRAEHALANAVPLSEQLSEQLASEYPQLQRYSLDRAAYDRAVEEHELPQLWIVDPHGNLVLRYGPATDGKKILNDMRQLLKLSQIG